MARVNGPEDRLCQYEKKGLKNVRKNNEMMRDLGKYCLNNNLNGNQAHWQWYCNYFVVSSVLGLWGSWEFIL